MNGLVVKPSQSQTSQSQTSLGQYMPSKSLFTGDTYDVTETGEEKRGTPLPAPSSTPVEEGELPHKSRSFHATLFLEKFYAVLVI